MLRTWYGAGVIAGIAVFFWGGLAHMVLGLGGESTFKQVPDAALAAMSASMKDPGLYMFPYTMDRNEMPRLLEKNPSGMMVYAPPGTPLNMGPLLALQAVTDILGCLIAAWLFSLALPQLRTFAIRVGFVIGLSTFAFMMSEAQYWNWYRFPTDFTAFALAFKLSCALVAGVVLALLLGRSAKST